MRATPAWNLRWERTLAALVAATALCACGGGGGGEGSGIQPASPNLPQPVPGSPTATGDTATDGFAWFNYRRSQVGLSTLTRNAQLDVAAAGHSNYLRLNNTVSHEQIGGSQGYTGATQENRMAAAGYRLVLPYAYGEVISAAGDRAGFFHAEELITAIYHRFAIFEPVFREMGVGAASANNYTYFTTDFAASGGYGTGLARGTVAVYPANNQIAVPANFMSDSETPDPVPNANEVGYPISVHANISSTVTVTAFTVKPRGGAELPARLLAHAGDSRTPPSAAAIVPLARLSPGTTYDVSFSGTVDSVAVTRNWSFTTK